MLRVRVRKPARPHVARQPGYPDGRAQSGAGERATAPEALALPGPAVAPVGVSRHAPAALRATLQASNAPQQAQILRRMQQAYGNAFVQRMLAGQPGLPGAITRTPLPLPGPAPITTPAGPPRAARGAQTAPPALTFALAVETAPARPAAEPAAAPAAPGAEAAAPAVETAPARPAAKLAAAPAAPATAATPTVEAAAAPAPPVAETAPAAEGLPTGPAAGEAETAAAAPAAIPSAEHDPRFQQVMQRLEATARREKAHEPASRKVAQARAAAHAPDNERRSRAQAAQVAVMDQQEAGKPDKESFLAILRAKLAEIAPKTMEETEAFKAEGKAGQLKASLTSTVQQQKEASERDIKAATNTEPDPERVPVTPETPLPEEQAAPAPGSLGASAVLPAARPEAEISVAKNKETAEQLMAENDIDDEQLERANEPQFSAALEAKQQLVAHADQVPEAYRADEQTYLNTATQAIESEERSTRTELRASRERATTGVKGRQQAAKSKEEAARKQVADTVQGIYAETRKKVEDKLNSLDGEVNTLFDTGEKQARERFETYVDRRMAAYKWERYINTTGGSLLWAKDKLLGLPDEVNRFYEEGRDQYLRDMEGVLVKIAATVETRLKEAKDAIAAGKVEIRTYLEGLPRTLQDAGRQAERDIAAKFEELQSGIDAKKEDLAAKLARRYQESREKLDERIKELKEANKGLLSDFIEKIKGIIKILRDFKARVGQLLKQAGNVVGLIAKDPIKFLGNLIAAISRGFSQFSANIETHLKRGLIDWLFGALSETGITIPSEFSLKAIFGLVLEILGITVEHIRKKVTRLIGAKNVALIERVWGFMAPLISAGPAALWEQARQYLGDLKERILGEVREWVIGEIVKNAVLWVLSLFNPVAALIKAIIAIYDVIMFFIENIERILQLVEAVIQSVVKIVMGQIGAAANWIEQAMGRIVSLIINFLARLLRLGGIGQKIRAIIKKFQKPVSKAIDKVLAAIMRKAKGIIGKVIGAFGREKETKGKPASLIEAVKAAVAARTKQPFKSLAEAQKVMTAIHATFKQQGLKSLRLVAKPGQQGKAYEVEASASPATDVGDVVLIAADVIAPAPGNIRYAVDSLGRPYRAWGWLAKRKGRRDPAAQARVSKPINDLMERLGLTIRFDAGHLIGDRYGGEGSEQNLVPQESGANQSWYKTFESVVARYVKETKPNEYIFADVRAVYPGDPFKDLVDDSTLASLSRTDRLQLATTLQRIPEALVFSTLGKLKANGERVDLPTPPPFAARTQMPSLGRSLKGVVGRTLKRCREVFRSK